MSGKKISEFDVSLFRIQAMLETSLKIQVEILCSLSKKDFKEISRTVAEAVDKTTKELTELHSRPKAGPSSN